jgi:hypothetical protein
MPEYSFFAGYDQFDGYTAFGKVKVPQPIFYSYNATTTVILPSGATVLLAVHDCEHQQNRDKVFFVLLSAAVTRISPTSPPR